MAKMVVSFSVVPIGSGSPSVSKYVQKATEVLKRMGVKYKTGAGFTDVELDSYDQLAKIFADIEKELADMGALRIQYTVKIDRRLDKELYIEEKIARAESL